MASIHPTAVVDPQAEIAANVSIGPYCVVESGAAVGEGCSLASHVVIKTGTQLGRNNSVSEGAVLGGRPQHLRAGEQVGKLRIGEGNMIREHVTIHCGLGANDWTEVGSHNLIMVNAHVAHDCHVGSNVVLTNNVMIAGHVSVGDRAYVSGAVGIHQFCRIGQLAMVGGQAHLNRDVPPFVTVDGLSSHVVGLNTVGLRRNGFREPEVLQLKAAYRIIYRSGLAWRQVLETLQQDFPTGPAAAFYEFLSQSRRGIMQERRGPGRSPIRIFNDPETNEAAASVRHAV
ncbi:MAG: acyl-ACP--UDP-N-acetylglucosamine O-acyltransferase [Pirellulaceae bacterium]|nr:acyl-ACP--UDP-N-acetylglucosamine O-acyltransferase [Pirellulaceae bacterium]MCU0981007.1 acyl-ACP--UDP-N-acetylglucosamine O-acyltransferase [Pirellulaceae bacterium]